MPLDLAGTESAKKLPTTNGFQLESTALFPVAAQLLPASYQVGVVKDDIVIQDSGFEEGNDFLANPLQNWLALRVVVDFAHDYPLLRPAVLSRFSFYADGEQN
jgi:hypothetical protein